MEAAIIEKEAMRLPDAERAVLADRLIARLSRKPDGLDDAWLKEAVDRLSAYREGRIKAVDGFDALRNLRAEFPR